MVACQLRPRLVATVPALEARYAGEERRTIDLLTRLRQPQATDLTKPLRDIYTALGIEPPKKILALDPAPTAP